MVYQEEEESGEEPDYTIIDGETGELLIMPPDVDDDLS